MYIRDNGDSFAFNRPNRFNRLHEGISYTDADNESRYEENLVEEASENYYDDDNIESGSNINIPDENDSSIQEAAIEAFFIDEISRMSDDERNEFFNSDGFQALYEAGVVNKRAIVALNKESEVTRRAMIIAIELAKKSGDSLYERLKKNREIEKRLLADIKKKYFPRAIPLAKKAMRDYNKLNTAVGRGNKDTNKKFNKLQNQVKGLSNNKPGAVFNRLVDHDGIR